MTAVGNLVAAIVAAATLTTCGVQVVPGPQGPKGDAGEAGAQGAQGPRGHSIVFQKTPASSAQCASGGNVLVIAVDSDDDGQLDPSADSNVQTLVTCNGSDGQDGEDGADAPPTQFTPVEILNPCGDSPSVYDEVLLKLQDGTIIASFSDNANGKNTRLSVLGSNGSFQTTDGDACIFSLSGGVITYESHHY